MDRNCKQILWKETFRVDAVNFANILSWILNLDWKTFLKTIFFKDKCIKKLIKFYFLQFYNIFHNFNLFMWKTNLTALRILEPQVPSFFLILSSKMGFIGGGCSNKRSFRRFAVEDASSASVIARLTSLSIALCLSSTLFLVYSPIHSADSLARKRITNRQMRSRRIDWDLWRCTRNDRQENIDWSLISMEDRTDFFYNKYREIPKFTRKERFCCNI